MSIFQLTVKTLSQRANILDIVKNKVKIVLLKYVIIFNHRAKIMENN
jgi:hypothetical protein